MDLDDEMGEVRMNALLARRDVIVGLLDKRIAQHGEDQLLFDSLAKRWNNASAKTCDVAPGCAVIIASTRREVSETSVRRLLVERPRLGRACPRNCPRGCPPSQRE